MSNLEIDGDAECKEALASIVYKRLRNDVISVAVVPGEKPRIRPLRECFDVGLSPVRKAPSRLSSEGLVARSDHRDFAVAPMTGTVDLTRTRPWLNEIAVRQSIENGDAAREESVVLCFHRLPRTPRQARASDSNDGETERSSWEVAHRDFHTAGQRPSNRNSSRTSWAG